MRHLVDRDAISPGLRRETRLVALDLGISRGQQVDTAHVSELDQVDKHVSSFISDPGAGSRILQVTGDFRIVNPLQLRSKFADFRGQGQRQVTDRVPTPPASRRSKTTQAAAEDIELARHGPDRSARPTRLARCLPASADLRPGHACPQATTAHGYQR